MRNRTIIIPVLTILLVCMTVSASAEKRWVSAGGTEAVEKPRSKILTSNDSETIVRFEIPGFWMENVTEEGMEYQILRFPDYATTQEIGKPELPVINEFIAIPARSGVKAHLIDYETTILGGYSVYPFQKIPGINERQGHFEIDRDFYGRSRLYPETVRISEPGIWRDLRLVNLRISPIRYNPATGELHVYTSVTVRLEYTGENKNNMLPGDPDHISHRQAEIYGGSVLNFDELDIPEVGVPPDQDYDLLIIAEDRFIDALDEFTDWKGRQGYKVKLVPVSSVGTTAAAIKTFVTTEYEDYGIGYLLLVGTEEPAENAIPFYIYNPDTNNQVASDYYYGLLAGNDMYPDIGVGRFSVLTESELETLISKSITYESDPPEGEWLEKAILVAHKEGAPGSFQGCMESVRIAENTESGHYYGAMQPQFTTAYGATAAYGGDYATNQDLINYFNAGARVVGYYGHGTSYSWGGWNYLYQSFGFGELDQLTNSDMTPVTVAIACETANPGLSGGCLGERLTRMSGGAVAYYGASYVALGNDDINKHLYTALFDYGATAISDATNIAQMRTLRDWLLWPDFAKRFLWYGDPTLSMIFNEEGISPPELVYPGFGESVATPGPVTLDWEDAGIVKGGTTWATAYYVQVDDDPDFSSPIVDEGYIYSEYTTPDLAEGIYYWRVRIRIGSDPGIWSGTSHFFVGIPTAATTLVKPTDNARVVVESSPTNPNLYWINFVWQNPLNPPEYLLEIDDDSDFSSPEIFIETSASGNTVELWGLVEGTKYYWRVCGRSAAAWPWSETNSFTFTREAGGGNGKPDQRKFTLPTGGISAYPNPFNPSTTISFDLPTAGRVKLGVFNVNGALIATLLDEVREAGRHDVPWNGRDARGRTVASGVYFYRLETGTGVTTKKLMLLR